MAVTHRGHRQRVICCPKLLVIHAASLLKRWHLHKSQHSKADTQPLGHESVCSELRCGEGDLLERKLHEAYLLYTVCRIPIEVNRSWIVFDSFCKLQTAFQLSLNRLLSSGNKQYPIPFSWQFSLLLFVCRLYCTKL